MDGSESTKKPACERCYRRKSRCDKSQPACSSCIKSRTACNYDWRDQTSNRRTLAALTRRLVQSEAKNETLSRELEALRGQTPAALGLDSPTASQVTPHDPRLTAQDHSSNVDTDETGEQGSSYGPLSIPLTTGSVDAGQSWGSQSASILFTLVQGEGETTNSPRGPDAPIPTITRRFRRKSDNITPNPQELKVLVSRDLATKLVEAYLSHDYLIFPILWPQSLARSLDAVYSTEEPISLTPHESFILDMVLALGTVRITKFDWHGLPDAETHHERACARLDLAVRAGGTAALQAIILTCQYRLLSASRDSSVSLWHLVGTAARLCLEMGLHQEAQYGEAQPPPSSNEANHQELRNETRRRCFWSVVTLDRVVSITLGKPAAIHQDDLGADLPVASGGEVLLRDEPISLTDSGCCESLWHSTQWFVHLVRYRLICGQIFSMLHKPATRYGYQQDADESSVRAYLNKELNNWHKSSQVLPLRASTSSLTRELEMSSLSSREWYDLLYHTAVLMLYRPVHAREDSLPTGDALQRLFESATESIKHYSAMHRTRTLNYSWLSLNSVYVAGLSYLYAVRLDSRLRWRPSLATRYQQVVDCLPSNPGIMDIVATTRACSSVLVAICERWSSAWNRHLAFGELADVVLKEVLELAQVSPDYNSTPPIIFGTDPGPLLEEDSARQLDLLGTPTRDFLRSYQWCFEDAVTDENYVNYME